MNREETQRFRDRLMSDIERIATEAARCGTDSMRIKRDGLTAQIMTNSEVIRYHQAEELRHSQTESTALATANIVAAIDVLILEQRDTNALLKTLVLEAETMRARAMTGGNQGTLH